jgi:large subunit ribosomal protein L29
MASAGLVELRELDDRELLLRRHDIVQELVAFKFQRATGQLDNTAKVPQLRRDLARIKTLIRQREIEAKLQKGGIEAQVGSLKDEIGKGYSKIRERFGMKA